MRVLLVKPPNRGFYHMLMRHFPVGPAYLASVLRAAGHEVSMFDALAYPEDNHIITELMDIDKAKLAAHPRWHHLIHWGASWERIRHAIEDAQPDVVGISCMFSCYHHCAYEVARIAKRSLPNIPVIVGGPHATSLYERVLREREVDVVSLGESEDSIVPLVEHLHAGLPLTELAGVAFRCQEQHCTCAAPGTGALHVTPRGEWRQDLDGLPYPRVDDVEWSRYQHATTLITSRGCPFSCSFCSVHATVGKKFRARDPKCVVDEIEWYVAKGVSNFNIEDDNFTFDMDRVLEICNLINQRNIHARFFLPNGITALKLSDNAIQTMSDVGFWGLFIGLETTDPAILKAISKSFTSLEKVVEGTTKFAAAGVLAKASLIIGLPAQSVRTVAIDTTNLLSRGIPTTGNAFYPVPGAPDFRRALDAGLIDDDTDPGMLEGPAYHQAFEMDSPTVYWTTMAVYALNMAFPSVVAGQRALREGKVLDYDALLTAERLTVAGNVGGVAPVFEPGAMSCWVPREKCLCGTNGLARGRGHGRICTRMADIASLLVALVSPRRSLFIETQCAVADDADVCRFEVAGELPAVATEVLQIFTSCVHEVLDGPRPMPSSRPAKAALKVLSP